MKKKRTKRRRFHRQTAPGATAGAVAVDSSAALPQVTVISYGAEAFERMETASLQQIQELRKKPGRVLWVHVSGLGESELILRLGTEFGLHRLALEDVVNVHQQVKVDDYADNVFVITRMLSMFPEASTQQLGLFVGEDFVVSFEEEPSELLKLIGRRIHDGHSQMRKNGPDFLAYAILDSIIDEYFPLLEAFGEHLDELEDEITDHPPRDLIHRIHEVRMELRSARRIVWQQREALNILIRSTNQLIHETTRLFLRDCLDHTIQLVELLEVYHENCSDLRDIYLSSISNRMNEIMMVLTVIATIFIPLSFIAGLYGMNFNTQKSPLNMPELNWYFGYPFALLLMASVAGGLLFYFYRRGWIGHSS